MKKNDKETTTTNDILFNDIDNEIQMFLAQIQKDDDVNSCQCCIKFPTKKLQLLIQKDPNDEYPDIHQIPKEIVEKLSWSCRRFLLKSKNQKGAFYLKKNIN